MTEIKVGSKWRSKDNDSKLRAKALLVHTVGTTTWVSYERTYGEMVTVQTLSKQMFLGTYKPVAAFYETEKVYTWSSDLTRYLVKELYLYKGEQFARAICLASDTLVMLDRCDFAAMKEVK